MSVAIPLPVGALGLLDVDEVPFAATVFVEPSQPAITDAANTRTVASFSDFKT
jgi:hypothetical protein